MSARTSFRRRPYRIPKKTTRKNSVNMVRCKYIMHEEWKLISLVSLFLSGMIIGCITVRHTDNQLNAKMVTMFTDFVLLRNTNSLMATFLNSFSVSIIYLFIAYIFGLCAVGIPIIVLIPIVKGISLGMVAGYFYSTYNMLGAGYCMVIIFPAAIVALAALLYGCNESLVMSKSIYYSSQGKYPNQYENNFKTYNIRYLILILFTLLSAIIDTLFTLAFASKFNLV